tara:strand:- start:332 stop:1183 length:852 start_codon:yes stop_codon:yes gene_type:complete
MKMNKDRTILIVGRDRQEKMDKAMSFVSDNPLICYANEYDITDNFSIPPERGIIIEEVDYKPNSDLIKKTINEYYGQVVLLSSNQKDVPKPIFNMCKLKRATKKNFDAYLEEVAPNAIQIKQYGSDIFSMVRAYLIETDRDKVADLLKTNSPPDTQILSWIVPNIHPNKIAFVDSEVKRKWSSSYFYELLAYSHNGRMFRRMETPRRTSYSQIPKILRKVGLKGSDVYLLPHLLKDTSVVWYVSRKLNNADNRLLGLEKKEIKKPKDYHETRLKIDNNLTRWF